MPGVRSAAPVAEWIRLPSVWSGGRRVAGDGVWPAAVQDLRQASVVDGGTIFQDTRKPLRHWFLAMWFITSQKRHQCSGPATRPRARQLPDVMGVAVQAAPCDAPAGTGPLAWRGRGRRNLYVGDREEGVFGRETAAKAIIAIAIAIAVEKDGRGFGRVRLRWYQDVSICPSVCSTIRLAGLLRPASRRLPPPNHCDQRQPRSSPYRHAPSPQGGHHRSSDG